MSKKVQFCLMLLLGVLVAGWFSVGHEEESIPQTPTIGVLQLVSHPALDLIYQGLQDGLEEKGFKLGEDVEINYFNAEGDQSNLALMSEELVKENPTILVPITTPSTLTLASKTTRIPIVMAGITYPVEAGILDSEEAPSGNITGVSDRTPLTQQLDLMCEVMPQMKTLGILYTSSEDNAVIQAREMKDLALEKGILVKEQAITNTNDIHQAMEQLASSVDAVFIPIDNLLASAMNTVVHIGDSHQIPIFPSSDTMVKDGGVLAIGVDQYQLGKLTSDMVVSVLEGKKIEDLPVQVSNRGEIFVNRKQMEKYHFTLPEEVKEQAIDVEEE